MSERPCKVTKNSYLQKFFDFWSSKQKSCLVPMSEDPEIGESTVVEIENQQKLTDNTSSSKTSAGVRTSDTRHGFSCIFGIALGMIAFVYIIHLVGTNKYVGLTVTPPEQTPKIIGGQPAEKGEFPHQIVLLYREEAVCGASLLETDVIITSAHCFENSDDPNDYKIVAGEHNLNLNEGTEQIRQVYKIEKHPEYDNFHIFYDVALVFPSEDFILDDYVKKIEITEKSVAPAGNPAVVIGWGVKNENSDGHPFETLQKVIVPIVSAEECERIYGDDITSDGSAICAGYPQGRMDACQADSGGPMLIFEGDRHTLIGLVSWGHGCGRPGYPGIYANVPFFSEWIKTTINEFNAEKLLKHEE